MLLTDICKRCHGDVMQTSAQVRKCSGYAFEPMSQKGSCSSMHAAVGSSRGVKHIGGCAPMRPQGGKQTVTQPCKTQAQGPRWTNQNGRDATWHVWRLPCDFCGLSSTGPKNKGVQGSQERSPPDEDMEVWMWSKMWATIPRIVTPLRLLVWPRRASPAYHIVT